MQRTLSFIVASMLFGASAWANPPAFAARATVHAAGETAGKTAGENLEPRAYLPITIGGGSRSADCPTISTNTYAVVPIEGGYYKDNRITDENPDFRLSILGYATVNELLDLVDYNGGADPNAPRLHGLFRPNRRPRFKAAYLNYQWNWDDGPGSTPPYGSRGPINDDPFFKVTVLEMEATAGEPIYIPERFVPIYQGEVVAMVLYADEDELTLTYTRHDAVYLPGGSYVVYLVGFCVDPQLVASYRAQLRDGKRSTGLLPAVRNGQTVGTARQDALVVAIRDTARFMDPRSRKDWWQGAP